MTITLNLTPNEAKTLKRILWNVGGGPNGTRQFADTVLKKLTKQYPKFRDAVVDLTFDETKAYYSSIYFYP